MATPAHILIVEDEPHMQQGLRDNLEFEGYRVEVCGDGEAALKRMRETEFDLVLLDVMLPTLSGFDVCRAARGYGVAAPIIMLTAKGQELDRVLGLELGADDYVTKPFSLRELLARIKAVLRRAPAAAHAHRAETTTAQVGRLTVDFARYEAQADGAEADLTHRALDVLRYLYDHAGEAVARETLLAEVWGYDDPAHQPTTRTVDNFILKLRQHIEPDPARPRYIHTVHGVGYRLVP
jgi:DNA-binding response OmpR family regulator